MSDNIVAKNIELVFRAYCEMTGINFKWLCVNFRIMLTSHKVSPSSIFTLMAALGEEEVWRRVDSCLVWHGLQPTTA